VIAVVVPSRGRPGNIAALIEAWRTTSHGYATLDVVVDEDDPCVDEYTRLDLPGGDTWVIEPRRLGGALNYVCPQIAEREHVDMVGFMGDDHRPRSDGWDIVIDTAGMDAPPAVVYGNDLVHGPGLPTAVFMDARIVRTLGHFVLPGQIHLWMDNYWKTLGEQLGTLRYLPDVVIEHVHPITGKAEWDEHYIANNAHAVWENDERIYKEWVATQMPADIARVKAALS